MTEQASRTAPARLNRAAVLATAAGLADQHGLRHVTVSAVARAVGVRTPSLYTHVRGNDDLRAGLTGLALGELADRGDHALAGRSGREALEAWAQVQRDYAREHPGRFETAGTLDVPVDATLEAAGKRVADQALAVLRAYGVPEEERVHAARYVASTLRGFVQLEAGGAFGHRDASLEESWSRMIDALDRSLRDW